MAKSPTQSPASGKKLYRLIAKRIDSIPTLPIALVRLLGESSLEDQANRSVARLVEVDPALTAKVLKVINSQFYGRRFRISTLTHAIAMLGLSALKNLAAGIAPFQAPEAGEVVLDRERYWQHSLAVAAASRTIAQMVHYDLPEEAYTGGLLHDIGKVVLDLYSPTEHLREAEEANPSEDGALELEMKHLGVNHAEVGALVAEHWNLPLILRDAIRFHHGASDQLDRAEEKHRRLAEIVGAADRLCWAFGLGGYGNGRRPGDELEVHAGRVLSPEEIDRVNDTVHAEFTQCAENHGFRVEQGGDFLAALREANAAAARKLSRINPIPEMTARLAALGDVIRKARRQTGVDEMIESSLRSIQKGLGLDRVLFLRVDVDEERLQGSYLFDDTQLEVDVHDVNLPLNPDGLLGSAIRDGMAHRVDNWATDGDLLGFLGVVEVAAAPVIVNQQPLGVFCADYFFKNREISDIDVALLGIVGTDLGLAIENFVLARQSTKLRSLAAKDELTGINNRRNLMKLLQKEIERAARYASPLAVVMVDIDHFKNFNDTYGHQAGDSILAEVAQLIVAASRDIDVIGRYGGEEFMVVLPETHVDQAIVYAERLRATVEQFGRERRQIYAKCPMTISVGVTSLRRESDDIEMVIHRVDDALYAAKERGRNRVCVD